MQDIANEASLGIATLFRYFPRKEQLIVAVAAGIIEAYSEVLFNVVRGEGTCYEKMERLFDILTLSYQTGYQQNSRLIEAFECYVALSKEPVEDIEIYQTQYQKIISLLTELSMLGQQDGSVRADSNTVNYLITMMNAYGIFSKKAGMLSGIPAFHTKVDLIEQSHILKKIFLESIR